MVTGFAYYQDGNMINKERKLFVLDTNILMHDPTAIYHFQEHDGKIAPLTKPGLGVQFKMPFKK
jgi:hypothetical protein